MSIQVYQGEARKIAVSVVDQAGEPLAIDEAGIQLRVTGDTDIIDLQVDSGITVTDIGKFEISLSTSDTSQVPRVYKYEIRLTLGAEVTTLKAGNFTILDSLFVA